MEITVMGGVASRLGSKSAPCSRLALLEVNGRMVRAIVRLALGFVAMLGAGIVLWSWAYQFVCEWFKGRENMLLNLVIFVLFGVSIVIHVLSKSPIICLICAVPVVLHVGWLFAGPFIREPQVGDALVTLVSPTRRLDPEYCKAGHMCLGDRRITASKLGFAVERGAFEAEMLIGGVTMRDVHIGAGLASTEFLRLLLRAEGDAGRGAAVLRGPGPLLEAARVGNVENCRTLIRPDVSGSAEAYMEAVRVALGRRHWASVVTLLEAGRDVMWSSGGAEVEMPSVVWEWALTSNRFHLARSLVRSGVNVSPSLWVGAPFGGELQLSKARALANGGLGVNFTDPLTWEAICGAGNASAAMTELVLDMGADPNVEVSGFPLLGWVLFEGPFLLGSAGCQYWREVADELVKAGGSLQLGAGQKFEEKAIWFISLAVGNQRCEQLEYAWNLPAKALHGVDVPAEELEPLLQRLREMAAHPVSGARRAEPVRCFPPPVPV
jgi:hypothetical protein